MKKIIICGCSDYTKAVLKVIEEASQKLSLSMPEVVCETRECKNLIEIAKTEQFPLFILDKNLPTKDGLNQWENALLFSYKIRMERGEKDSVYGAPQESKAAILIYTEEDYSFSERNNYYFWRANMYLLKGVDASDEDLGELTMGADVFADKEWRLNALWENLAGKYRRRAG